MKNISLTILALAAIALCLCAAPSFAEQGDDDAPDAPASGSSPSSVLTPDLLWQLADNAWNTRHFDDAVATMTVYVKSDPDGPQCLEALWRASEAYRYIIPNKDKYLAMYTQLDDNCNRWTTEFKDNDKEKAAAGLWYQGNLFRNAGRNEQAEAKFHQLVKQFPTTSHVGDCYWNAAHWEQDDKQYQEAATDYEGYVTVGGNTENTGLADLGSAACEEALKDAPDAVTIYKAILTKPYNWGWWNFAYGALDAAKRLRDLGEPEMMRAYALKIIDDSPQGWTDLQTQAHDLLGDTVPKSISIEAQDHDDYDTDEQSVGPTTKMDLLRHPQLLVRLSRITKDDPLNATVEFTPKDDFAKIGDTLTKGTDNGKDVLVGKIAYPDDKGNTPDSLNYQFDSQTEHALAPADVTVSRSWDKEGANWGIATIRIQSSARWDIYIYMPSTDAAHQDNITGLLPNEVQDGGKTFHWYNWADLTQGLTLKIPITFPEGAAGAISNYCPKVFLYRGYWRDGGSSGKSQSIAIPSPTYDVKITTDKPLTYSMGLPIWESITLDEVSGS